MHTVTAHIVVRDAARAAAGYRGEGSPGKWRAASNKAAAHPKGEEMTLGLRTLMMLLAMIVFIVAALNNDHFTALVAIGLALFAGSFVVEESGIASRLTSTRH